MIMIVGASTQTKRGKAVARLVDVMIGGPGVSSGQVAGVPAPH